MSINDSIIIKKLKEDNKKALVMLYDSYWKPLFISSYNLLKDKEVCEEIIQDVFIETWNKRFELEIKVSLKSYLYSCVRYKVFSEFRKVKPLNVEIFNNLNDRFEYVNPETILMHEELRMQTQKIMDILPKKCKQVFILSRVDNLSHKEIAKKLNISPKTVENHITIALKIFRDSLGKVISIELFILLFSDFYFLC